MNEVGMCEDNEEDTLALFVTCDNCAFLDFVSFY